jgi:WD40 repeat protein
MIIPCSSLEIVHQPRECLVRLHPVREGLAALGGLDVHLFDVDQGRVAQTISTGPVNDLSVRDRHDENLLAIACQDGHIRLLNLQSQVGTRNNANGTDCNSKDNINVSSHPNHEGPVLCCDLSGTQNHIASGGLDQYVQIRDMVTGRPIMRTCAHADAVLDVAFCPAASHGNLLASSGADGVIRLWDARIAGSARTPEIRSNGHAQQQQQQIACIIDDDNPAVTSVQWSADGAWLLSTTVDDCVRLWDVRAAGPYAKYSKSGHHRTIKCARCFKGAAFRNRPYGKATFLDNQTILTVDQGALLIMWDVQTKACVFKQPLGLDADHGMLLDFVVLPRMSSQSSNDDVLSILAVTGDTRLWRAEIT